MNRYVRAVVIKSTQKNQGLVLTRRAGAQEYLSDAVRTAHARLPQGLFQFAKLVVADRIDWTGRVACILCQCMRKTLKLFLDSLEAEWRRELRESALAARD